MKKKRAAPTAENKHERMYSSQKTQRSTKE